MFRILSAAFAASFLCGAASAATIAYSFDTRASESLNQGADFVDIPARALTATLDDQGSTATDNAEAKTRLNVDPLTGEIKFMTGATATYDTAGSTAFSKMTFKVRETFTASGSGSATFAVALEGLLKESGGLRIDEALIEATMTVRGPGNNASGESFQASTNDQGFVSQIDVDHLFSATFAANDGDRFIFEFSVTSLSSASAGSTYPNVWAENDFLNTATIFATGKGGTTLTGLDPNFLSGQVSGEVTLPAGMPLLVGALGLTAWFGRRRRAM